MKNLVQKDKQFRMDVKKIKTQLKSNVHLQTLIKTFLTIGLLSIMMSYFNILTDYIYVLEFLLSRLVLVIVLLVLLQVTRNLPIIQGFQEELKVFNQEPKNNAFVVLLRKYHFTLFLFGYFCFSLATTYFAEDIMVSYVFGIVSFVCVILYLVQFVVYMQNYLALQTKETSIVKKPHTRGVSTLASYMTIRNAHKVGVVCLECAKAGLTLGLGAEAGWKLTHGGMNDMSPWRQHAMNQLFPNDRTKVWTETKAGMAMHNRAMGYPHDNIYKSGETLDQFRNSIAKKPPG